LEGIVVKSTGSWYIVRQENGKRIDCKLKGIYRIKGLKATNPIAVGDHVDFVLSEKEKTGMITSIAPRSNYIIRRSINLSKQTHIIASNIDQAILIVTLAFPRTSTGFIDRFLITAAAYHIPVKIIFNKCDLFTGELKEHFENLQDIYIQAGYDCIVVSATKKINTEAFKNLLKDKTSLISGHSGVGKSALINAIEPSLNLKTAEISLAHLKGIHTTTFAEMHELSFGGFVIDTPGIKELGLIDFKKEEISHFFPEIFKHIHQCKFNNCLHTHEVQCAVKRAVESGEIGQSRYNSYVSILNGDDLGVEEWELK